MRHSHVTVTLEADAVARIESRLQPGETVAAWVAEAARLRLDPEDGAAERTGDERERPRYEFVDDCRI